MVEDGCEPDLDLPALDLNQPIARFEFDSYCLVQSTAFEGAAFGSGADQQGSAEPESRVVRVQCAREWSKLKIEATMTVKELIATVVAKRKMRADIESVYHWTTCLVSYPHLSLPHFWSLLAQATALSTVFAHPSSWPDPHPQLC